MQQSQTTLVLIYHVDPGHGWIEVSASLVERLGILDQISEFSYYSHNTQTYYLEEDCDAGVLMGALDATGQGYAIRAKEHSGDAFIRRMARVGAV